MNRLLAALTVHLSFCYKNNVNEMGMVVCMPKRWTEDKSLVEGLAGNLLELLPIYPRQLLRLDQISRKHQLPLSHIQLLALLSSSDQTVGEISSRLSIAKPNVTPLVNALQEAGLAERCHSETDKRLVSVRLLPTGKAKLQAIQQDIIHQLEAWEQSFSRSEIRDLNAALATIIRLTGNIPS